MRWAGRSYGGRVALDDPVVRGAKAGRKASLADGLDREHLLSHGDRMTRLNRHDRGPQLDPPVACPMIVIAVKASKSPGIWGTQIEVKPASSAALASAMSCATFCRYRPRSGPGLKPIRIVASFQTPRAVRAPPAAEVLVILFSFCESTSARVGA